MLQGGQGEKYSIIKSIDHGAGITTIVNTVFWTWEYYKVNACYKFSSEENFVWVWILTACLWSFVIYVNIKSWYIPEVNTNVYVNYDSLGGIYILYLRKSTLNMKMDF